MPKVQAVSLADALSSGPPPPGNLAIPVFSRGTVEVELYAPAGEDSQPRHERDEIYFVARGRATFFDGAHREPVSAGSFLFVASGAAHRFEDASEDFATWVVFYGPVGGEAEHTA